MAVLEMTDKISEAIDKNYFSIRVFIHSSKAFDTLNHNILLLKKITMESVEMLFRGLNLF